MRVIWIALLGVGLLAGSAAGASKGGSVDLVAYSTPKDAYGQIISAFQKTPAGNGVDFTQSYGASGDQARAVAAGQKADVVALSLDPDVNLLVGQGLVPKNWNANAYKGSSPTRSWSSSCATATRSTSRAGATWSSRASR